ncbi:hypothetical protein LNAOJCKE_0399 [Methylorubrum aminovorans]|uniref:Uncharacterized protein n=1 Tax=Methylorubrum aminovorans TaxID=269069 RepID=A0ABQ4U6Y6_9HYPH|nr:hypothetical protein LNAOJCKE_0399 [Methylorubrum aminovorans]GMA79246.1 hypothetical protein GCM10025880_56630 [Methylorubrum aminovorans]
MSEVVYVDKNTLKGMFFSGARSGGIVSCSYADANDDYVRYIATKLSTSKLNRAPRECFYDWALANNFTVFASNDLDAPKRHCLIKAETDDQHFLVKMRWG